MTLPLNSRLSALYDTNGTQKDFGFGFRVFFDPDNGGYGLEVRRQTADGYEVIPKSDYLVLPVEDNSAGVVRFSVAPSAGQQIYIAGKTPTIQQLVLTNFGRYSAESIETQFDFITAIIQEWLSALGEETRQRIASDEILTQYVVQRIDDFVQQVNQNWDDKSQEIEDYIATIMPSFTQTLRDEIEAFAVAGMQDAIDQALAESKAEIDDAVARANAAALAAAITGKVYDTPEAGVDPVTGVQNGAYYNVRSPDDDSYLVEYQNVGGVPTPSGKSYPSAAALADIKEAIIDPETNTATASKVFTQDGVSLEVFAETQKKKNQQSVNLDDFKTATNTDTDSFKAALLYCDANNIGKLNITRDIELDDRVFITQSNFKIELNDHEVKWVGQGQNNLKFAAINFNGELTATSTTVAVSAGAYQTSFVVASSAGFSVGDDILIKSTSIISPMIYLNHCVRIVAISGNSITVDTVIRLPLDLAYGAINVTKVNTIKNSSVLNLKFTAMNQNSRSDGITGVYFENTFGCSASVSCYGLYFKGLKVNNSNGFVMLGGRGDKPAATDGGEGYGFQFEYCVNSQAYNLKAYNMRHCLDVTASWNIYAKDCFDYYSMSSSFGTHKAFEYDVTFENCHSIASNEHGFYFGSAAPLFGQTADKIKMKNCSVLRSRNICMAYTTLGKGLIIEDCILDPIAGVGIYSAVVANNDVEFVRTKTTSGISIVGTATENAYTAGFCKFSGSDINANANVARSLTIAVGASVEFSGGILNGMVNARSNTVFTLNHCDWMTTSVTGWLDAAQDGTQAISLDNVKLKASHAAVPTYTYDWKVKSLRFNNVKFDVAASIANKHKMSNVDTVIKNSFGAVAILLDGTSATRFSITNNDFYAIAANEIISSNSAYPLTCPVDIDDNVFKATSNANSAIVIGTTGAVVSRLSVQRNSGVGRIRVGDANVTKCIIMGNNCDGDYLLPTHDTTNKVVQFNI